MVDCGCEVLWLLAAGCYGQSLRLLGCVGCWCLALGAIVVTVGCCGQWLLDDLDSGCQALWEVPWAVATGVLVLWEND